MQSHELFASIKAAWLERMALTISRGTGTREDWLAQMEIFYNLLLQALKRGIPELLDPLISGWAANLTQTDLEEENNNLNLVLQQITIKTFEVSREHLKDSDALILIGDLLPCFTHAFEVASSQEMQARVSYVSNQLAQARQTLERLDRSKSDFIAVAAHELKTPLTLIEGYASMLKDTLEKPQTGGQDFQYLNGIHTGTRRLRAIIDDMIDVSMIDNNLLSLNFQPIWLNRLLLNLKMEVAKTVAERNLHLEFVEFEGSTKINYGDPERLLQVFRNILSNSIKYTPDGGAIRIDGRTLPGFIEITFTDTGIGIDPDNQLIIFDKFTQVGSTSLHSSGKTKFKGGGPGLGLHIARGIIEGHGGAIWVESAGCDEEICPGSTFHVIIPVRTETPDEKNLKIFTQLTDTQTKLEVS
jgi:signal transduction histidine kinase